MDPVGCIHSALGDGANQINQNAAAYTDWHYCYSLQGCAAVNLEKIVDQKSKIMVFFLIYKADMILTSLS